MILSRSSKYVEDDSRGGRLTLYNTSNGQATTLTSGKGNSMFQVLAGYQMIELFLIPLQLIRRQNLLMLMLYGE